MIKYEFKNNDDKAVQNKWTVSIIVLYFLLTTFYSLFMYRAFQHLCSTIFEKFT